MPVMVWNLNLGSLWFSSGLKEASLNLENSELKRAKMYQVPSQITKQSAVVGKKNSEHSYSKRRRKRAFLQTLVHSNSKILMGRYYEVPYPEGMECSLLMPWFYSLGKLLCSLFVKSLVTSPGSVLFFNIFLGYILRRHWRICNSAFSTHFLPIV